MAMYQQKRKYIGQFGAVIRTVRLIW